MHACTHTHARTHLLRVPMALLGLLARQAPVHEPSLPADLGRDVVVWQPCQRAGWSTEVRTQPALTECNPPLGDHWAVQPLPLPQRGLQPQGARLHHRAPAHLAVPVALRGGTTGCNG